MDDPNGQLTDKERTANGQLTTNKNVRKKEYKKKEKEYSDEFILFWDSSTKQGNKFKASQSYATALEVSDADTILEGMRKHKAKIDLYKQTEYIPHVTTWLNQRRRDDDYTIPEPGSAEDYKLFKEEYVGKVKTRMVQDGVDVHGEDRPYGPTTYKFYLMNERGIEQEEAIAIATPIVSKEYWE